MWWIWIAVLVAAVIIEALTNDFVAIWFFPAAVISLVLSFFDVSWWIQLLVFVLVGLVLVFSTRPLCRKFLKPKIAKTNVDALIGRTCVVTEKICNIDEVGEVKVGGLCWSARAAEEDRVIEVGTHVEIVEIKGVKLIVK